MDHIKARRLPLGFDARDAERELPKTRRLGGCGLLAGTTCWRQFLQCGRQMSPHGPFIFRSSFMRALAVAATGTASFFSAPAVWADTLVTYEVNGYLFCRQAVNDGAPTSLTGRSRATSPTTPPYRRT